MFEIYEENGIKYWKVYHNLRSKKNPRIRVQKKATKVKNELEAKKLDKLLYKEAIEEVFKRENEALSWDTVVEKWASFQTNSSFSNCSPPVVSDYVALMRKWTTAWSGRPCNELNRGDGRLVLELAQSANKSKGYLKRLKQVVNVIWNWAVEERVIMGVQNSPMFGLKLEEAREAEPPEILSLTEVQNLLVVAEKAVQTKTLEPVWWYVWTVALLTGGRSGEIQGLRKEDCNLVKMEEALEQERRIERAHERRYGNIQVRRSWNKRIGGYKTTKAGYWRNVPVSGELYWFIQNNLWDQDFGNDQFGRYLLPRHNLWRKGEQARVLRQFCVGNRLPSVKFHTLRACFATHLIRMGVTPVTIMKICGWTNLKTMQRYVRLAGIDEAGATEGLNFISSQEEAMEKVVDLLEYRTQKR